MKVSDLALTANAHRVVDAANWVTREQATALGARIVPPDSVVFPKVGAALLGNARGRTGAPLLIDNNMMAVVPTNLDPAYSYWWLRSVDMAHLSEGGALPFVSDTAVRDLRVPVMSVNTQRRIADFLDDRVTRIDQIIAARERQTAHADERFSAARRNLVLGLGGPTRRVSLPWAESVGVDWEVRRLSQLARMGTGHTPSRSEPDYWVECRIPWLTTSDVHKFRRDEIDRLDGTEANISELGLTNSAAVLHPAQTVALSRTASAGFSIIMDRDMATSQDFVTWTCGDGLNPEFLLHFLRAMRHYLLGYLSMGSTHKTIYFPDLMDLRVAAPSAARQRTAVEAVHGTAAERNGLIRALTRQVDLLGEFKQSLITAAVTGGLDVTTAGSGIPG